MMDMHGFGGVPRGRAERLRELLAIPPLDGAAEELPAIADVDPDGELGNDAPILYNRSSRGFVRSPWVEEDLDEALRDRKVILLAGKSESGKWRTAWEAVGRVLPDARLLVPRLGLPVLAELLSLDPPLRPGPGPGPVVVWLDRLDAYLATGNDMAAKTMERLQSLAPRVVILASVRGDVHTHLLGSQASFGPVARQLLAEAVTIVVPTPGMPARREWAGTGRSNADEERPDGTGTPAADTAILEGRYRDGRAGRDADDRADRTSRIGWMLVQAAADWRRMGMFRPVTERELRELAACYAAPGRQEQALDDARWDAALRWALAALPGTTASLLQEIPPDAAEDQGEPGTRAFRPAEFLASDRSGSEQATSADGWPRIPDAAWEFVLRRCDPFELIGVSTVANRDAAPATAEAALRRAMRSLDASSSSLAGLLLAGRLETRGDTSGAIAAYRQCIADGEHVMPEFAERWSEESGDRGRRSRGKEAGPATAAFACVNLGSLLSRKGRLQEATEVWRKGMSYQDSGGAPLCAMNLGGFLAKNHDLLGARDAYQQALAGYARHGDPDKMHGMAAVDLGFILIELDEESAARAAFETAIHSGHPVAAPRAATALGMILLVSDQDKASAKRAFGVAVGADDPNVAARARLELGKLKEQAQPDEAISDYRALEKCGIQDVAEEALLRLGVVFHDVRRNLPAAEEAFRKVTQSDDPLRKSKAAMALGRLLLGQRDWAGAREALQLAVNAPEPGIAGFALVFLGDALAMLGQPDEARRAYFRASRSANPRVSEMADDRLDRRAWQRGEAMSDGGTGRADDGAEPGGVDPVAGRLDAVTEALVARQLTVWRRDVYRDRDGDGTGDVGWLWLRAGQRAFPARDHDVLLQYGADEAEWQASTPDGRTRRIADAGPDALAAAVAAFATHQPEDPGAATQGETPEGAVVSGAASRLPPAETLRNLPDWITLMLGGVTTAVVIPFVQVLATTTATDVYKKIKDKLSRDEPESVAAASTGYVQVTDSDADVQLIYPEPIPPRAVEKLIKKLTERDLSELRGCTLVWDTAREDWFLCRLA